MEFVTSGDLTTSKEIWLHIYYLSNTWSAVIMKKINQPLLHCMLSLLIYDLWPAEPSASGGLGYSRPPHTLLSGHEYSYVVYTLMGVYNEISGSTEWLNVGGVEQRDHIQKCLIAPCVSSNAAWYLIGILKSLSSIYLYTFIPSPPPPQTVCVCVWSLSWLDPHAGWTFTPV